jgi:hypothetical protein
MLDHVEGETVTEELLREWATKAWREGKKRQNVQAQTQRGQARPINEAKDI